MIDLSKHAYKKRGGGGGTYSYFLETDIFKINTFFMQNTLKNNHNIKINLQLIL